MYEIFVKLCERDGVRPSTVSKATHISQSYLSNWKSRKTVPKLDKLSAIANYFRVPITYFIMDDKNEAVI